MVSYRCVGYGITNSSGVATLDHNLDGTSISGGHSYTGSGVGELDFVASVDSPTQINNGSDVSQPYIVIDSTFLDRATSSDYNDTGWNNTRINLTRETDNKKLEWNGNNTNGLYYRSYTANTNICIEFDLNFKKTSSSTDIITFYKDWNIRGYIRKNQFNLSEETWVHFKIELEEGTGTITTSTSSTPVTFTCTDTNRFAFTVDDASGDYTKFKNFVVYPI